MGHSRERAIPTSSADALAIARYQIVAGVLATEITSPGLPALEAYLKARVGFYRARANMEPDQQSGWEANASYYEAILNGSLFGKKVFCRQMIEENSRNYRLNRLAAMVQSTDQELKQALNQRARAANMAVASWIKIRTHLEDPVEP